MSTDEDDDWKPSAEDTAIAAEFYELAGRHPTMAIIMRIVHSRARLKKLVAMEAPEVVIANERSIMERRLDDLCAAMPFDPEVETFPLPGIIEHFRDELLHPPGSGDDA